MNDQPRHWWNSGRVRGLYIVVILLVIATCISFWVRTDNYGDKAFIASTAFAFALGMFTNWISYSVFTEDGVVHSQLAKLGTSLDGMKSEVHNMFVGGLRLFADRSTLENGEFYVEHYGKSEHIEVVGLTSKSVIRGLYGAFWGRLPYESQGIKRRLDELESGPLYKYLESGLRIDVYLVNPECDYAGMRAKEEGNRDCVEDARDVIHVLGCLKKDLDRREAAGIMSRFQGEFNVHLLCPNPYLRIFKAKLKGSDTYRMLLGLFLQGVQANRAPVLFVKDAERAGDVPGAIERHMGKIAGGDGVRMNVFSWRAGKVEAFDPVLPG